MINKILSMMPFIANQNTEDPYSQKMKDFHNVAGSYYDVVLAHQSHKTLDIKWNYSPAEFARMIAAFTQGVDLYSEAIIADKIAEVMKIEGLKSFLNDGFEVYKPNQMFFAVVPYPFTRGGHPLSKEDLENGLGTHLMIVGQSGRVYAGGPYGKNSSLFSTFPKIVQETLRVTTPPFLTEAEAVRVDTMRGFQHIEPIRKFIQDNSRLDRTDPKYNVAVQNTIKDAFAKSKAMFGRKIR